MGEMRKRARGKAEETPPKDNKDVLQRVEEYQAERARRNCKPLADKSILNYLRNTRDGLVFWVRQCVELGLADDIPKVLKAFELCNATVREMEVTIDERTEDVQSDYLPMPAETQESLQKAVDKILGGNSCASS